MYVIATILVLICGFLGGLIFDSVFLGVIIGLILCFAGIFLLIAMPSKKEAKKNRSRKQEDKATLQSQWEDSKWMKENSTDAYQNRRALKYFGEIIDNPGTPKKRKCIVTLLWGFCGLFVVLAAVFTAGIGKATGVGAGIALLLVMAIVFAVIAICMKKSYAKKYVLWLKAVNYNFLEECKNQNIRTLNSREEIARLMMVCNKIGMDGTEEELVRRFKNAKQERNERQNVLSNRHKEDQIDRTLERDEQEVKKFTGYLAYSGREKMIRLCEDRAQQYRDKAEEYSNQLRSLNSRDENAYRNFSQKEHDWALHGGVASGIAGPIAGAVTALDIQAKNVKIKEHNKNVASTVAAVSLDERISILNKLTETEKEIEKWEKRAEEIQNKLVEELPEDQLLDMLNPTVVSMTYNSAGTLRISVEIQGAKPIIYDRVAASVDGFIRAVLKKDGVSVAEAVLMLPYNGSERKQKLTGICINAPTKDEIDSVEFEPIKLWAIER